MKYEAYRYSFPPGPPFEDVEAALLLAILAAESLHGESQVHLDATFVVCAEHRQCAIESTSTVGRDLNRLFVGFLRREFGDHSFHISRLQIELS
jgi:hypothetical protein